MQQLLARRGFDVGEPDGRFGPKTRAAIRDYQASVRARPGRLRHRRPFWHGCAGPDLDPFTFTPPCSCGY